VVESSRTHTDGWRWNVVKGDAIGYGGFMADSRERKGDIDERRDGLGWV